MCGEQLLISPVVQQGQLAKAVYLPEGTWFDYWTKEEVVGGAYRVKETPLDTCPIYVKAGSMIPNYPVQNYIGEKNVDVLRLDTYPGDGTYLHYQDDGESFEYQKGVYNTYAFSMEKTDQITIELKRVHKGYEASYRQFEFILHQIKAKTVTVNGEAIAFENRENTLVLRVDASDMKIQIVE
jgi:alpha-glucosidase